MKDPMMEEAEGEDDPFMIEFDELKYKARMVTYKQLESLLANQIKQFKSLLSQSVPIVSE